MQNATRVFWTWFGFVIVRQNDFEVLYHGGYRLVVVIRKLGEVWCQSLPQSQPGPTISAYTIRNWTDIPETLLPLLGVLQYLATNKQQTQSDISKSAVCWWVKDFFKNLTAKSCFQHLEFWFSFTFYFFSVK